jgi:hypothetical protein
MDKRDALFLFLPILLWPITFIVLKRVFIYSMLVSTFILAIISLRWYRKRIKWAGKRIYVSIIAGVIGAFLLYLVFYIGWYATLYLGMNSLVGNVYSMIYAGVAKMPLIFILALIGIFEEIYWRGALQGYIKKSLMPLIGAFPWIGSTLYYSAVHISTLNPILVLSAFFVGLVTSVIADRYGIISSMLTHIIWIELIVVFIPLL